MRWFFIRKKISIPSKMSLWLRWGRKSPYLYFQANFYFLQLFLYSHGAFYITSATRDWKISLTCAICTLYFLWNTSLQGNRLTSKFAFKRKIFASKNYKITTEIYEQSSCSQNWYYSSFKRQSILLRAKILVCSPGLVVLIFSFFCVIKKRI